MSDSEKRKASNAAYRARHPEVAKAYNAAHWPVYYAAHREASNARVVAWRAAHLTERLAYEAAYHVAHREERRAYGKAHHAAQRERDNARSAAYRLAHPDPEGARAYNAAWRTANPDRSREHRRKANTMRRGASLCDHASCLAIGAATLAWQVNEHVCYICGTPVFQGGNLHMDHVVPVSRGGIHCADNLRPACAFCNIRKHNRVA